jgi:integrase
MAFLQFRGRHYRIVFRFGGERYSQSLRTADEKEAQGCIARLEENLRLVERGRLAPPLGCHLPTFLLSDGQLMGRVNVPQVLTLGSLRDQYLSSRPDSGWEENTRLTLRVHFGHLALTFGESFIVQSLTLGDLQRHVNLRAKKKGLRGKPLSAATVRKEVATFRAAWNWASESGLLAGAFPNKNVQYQKADEKLPFLTLTEVERRLTLGSLTAAEESDLWDAVFLTLHEVDELLKHVRNKPHQPFLLPMMTLAAHTGMRRSELLRARVGDVDLETGVVMVRERKRSKDARTTRRVPLSTLAAADLENWLRRHPGGTFLFCQKAEVTRSKKDHGDGMPVTKDEANDHFKRSLVGSRFARLRGWHVLRHSFASNLAANGVDQRFIDEFMGHQTEIQRRRYRHLFPHQQRQVICRVFETVESSTESALGM